MDIKDPVSTIMHSKVVVANPFHNFSQALELFTNFGMHHLPIVDGQNKLIGILSSNDFLKVFTDPKYKGVPVGPDDLDKAINIPDIMTANVVTITPQTTIEEAAQIFAEKKFQAMPVVENDQIVGIVSVKDIMNLIAYF